MIDIHTHLLFDTDDGVEYMEKTICQIEDANKVGIDTICFTPHYIEPEYTKKEIQNQKKLDKIKRELKRRNIDTKLYLGNEIYISEDVNEFLSKNYVTTIANSDYLLIELPVNMELKNTKELLEKIIYKGKKIIIAHPERYLYVQKNIEYFDDFIKEGNLYLQGNYGSIIGIYGKNAQKTIIKMIKQKKLHVLASDIHKNDLYKKIPQALLKLKKIAEQKYINELTQEIPKRIINNEEIKISQKNVLKFKIGQIFKK